MNGSGIMLLGCEALFDTRHFQEFGALGFSEHASGDDSSFFSETQVAMHTTPYLHILVPK